MTKQQFLDPNTDMMKVYHFYFNLHAKRKVTYDVFYTAFNLWLVNFVGIHRLPELQYYVLRKLGEYFR